jgi:flagellar basal body-associated protein FliL
MMYDMVGSGMMWVMGLLWLLLAVLLVLGIAALAKYVFFR